LVFLLLSLAICGLSVAAEELTNDSGRTAVAVRITFRSSVRITGHGREFDTVEPSSGRSDVFVFSGGEVRRNRTFEVEWSPDSREIRSVEWLQEEDLAPPEPELEILAPVTYGEAPASISMEAVLANAEASSASFEWDFGDGSSEVAQSVNHSFAVMGVYRVVLTVSLDGSEPLVAEEIITVSPLHVNPATGDDSQGDGSISQPFKSITVAVSHAAVGQPLLLAPGIYNAASGEAERIDVPSSLSLIGGGVTSDDVKVVTDVLCQGTSILSSIHFIGTVYLAEERGQPALTLVADCRFTGDGSYNDYGVISYIQLGQATVRRCAFAENDAGIEADGPALVENCSIVDSGYGVLVSNDGDGVVVDSDIQRCHFGVWLLHGGRGDIQRCLLSDNEVGVRVSGESTGELAMEECSVIGGYIGVSLESHVVADLGGGVFGSSGGNTFSGSKDYSIRDERTMYSGALGAQFNSWPSAATGTLDGPAHNYNPARCYIENEGNSIIFSD
jgi:hypothetical protein